MKKGHDLAYWADQSFKIEKVRVAAQVRISHLAKRKEVSPETEKFLKLVQETEKFVDGYMAEIITSHPTWPWASKIKGVGKENFPKIIGLIESFGKYYNSQDPIIPPYVKREVQTYYLYNAEKDETIEKQGIFVTGIERLTNPSKLWKYAGFHVVDGHAAKRQSGKLLNYNSELRMAMYRLSTSLMKQVRENEICIWKRRYDSARQEIEANHLARGIKVVPTPAGRLCPICNIEVKKKATFFCPECGEKLLLKKEPEGYLYLGHLHMMALREMTKDFLLCLWLIWREAENLPVTQPYEVARLGHKPINPWDMVDRD